MRLSASDQDDRQRLAELRASGRVRVVVDPIVELADELFDLRRVGPVDDAGARRAFIDQLGREADSFGTWVFFDWSGELVRYPDRVEHRRLRTYRNRNLITAAEQDELQTARIAVFGLSVGSNLVDQLVQGGIGESYLLADYDRLGPSNLNRLRASMRHVGMTKVDVLARKISEADPWIDQVHLVEGYTPESDHVLDDFRPDLLIEEVDDLQVKARLRRWAAHTGTPLLMVGDIGEKSVLDVERHDLGRVRPFNGKLGEQTFQRLVSGEVGEGELRRLLMKIVGARHLNTRLLRSALNLDDDLAGMPQLGSTATAGAALASVAARAVLLGEPLRSGTYAHSPRRLLRLGPQAKLAEALATVRAARRLLSQSD